MVNIMDFGVCCVTGQTCKPIILGKWQQTKRDVAINGGCALTTDSWLQCGWGGKIKAEKSGQKK